MIIEKDKLEAIKHHLDRAKNILIVAHKNPDGDTLGAATAWYEHLKNNGKNVTLVCESTVPEPLKCIPNYEAVKHDFNLNDFDLAIVNDAGAKHVAGFYQTHPELFEEKIPVLNIDHHISNDMYGTVNVVIPLASTTCLIYEIFKELDFRITPRIATSLLVGIYTDTGSFHHSNADAYTFRVASKLLSRGANVKKLSKSIFQTTKISTMKLWGRVLSGIFKNDENITMSTVTEEDFIESGAKFDELTGVVDYLNSVPNSKFSVLLTEKDGNVKGSLRTLNDNIDLTEIAGRFGGGGHKKASGFTVKGKLKKEVTWKVVEVNE